MGILVNSAVIALGCLFGSRINFLNIGKHDHILGIGIMVISLVGFFENIYNVRGESIISRDLIIILLAYIAGSYIGEALHLHGRLSRLGSTKNTSCNAFIDTTLLFGVGGLQISGPIALALHNDNSQLFIKSFVDMPLALIAGATYGAVTALSVNIKSLEQELHIKIFERAGTGVLLTEEGAEFVRYARQIVDHSDFIVERYATHPPGPRLHVATQHYDFVADIFSKLVNDAAEDQYHFPLREMRTYDVIKERESAHCDIGIIAIKSSDIGVMERYLSKKGIPATPFLKAHPHIYVRNGHPLSRLPLVTLENLKDYPSVSYEQGEHSSTFFTEELVGSCSPRQVEISDRVSLMNILLATDCYTVGTGIMPSLLNENRIVSIPFECEEFYSIGCITRRDRKLSPLAQIFIDSLHAAAKTLQK